MTDHPPPPARWITPTQAASVLGLRRPADVRTWLAQHPEVKVRARGASYLVDSEGLKSSTEHAAHSTQHTAQSTNQTAHSTDHDPTASPAPPLPPRAGGGGISLDQITTLSRDELVALAASAPSVTGLSDGQLERLKLLTEIKHKAQLTEQKRGDLIKKSEASDAWTTAFRLVRTELERLGMNIAPDLVARSWPSDETVTAIRKALKSIDGGQDLGKGLTRPQALIPQVRAMIDRKVAAALEAAREALG